jgi:uncharacterized OB-fold protein
MKTSLQPVSWLTERLRIEEDGTAALIGMRCKECLEVVFPKSELCPSCTSDEIESIALTRPKGRVWSFSVVFESYGNVIGLTPPYPVAFIELEDGGYVQSVLLGLEGDLPEIGMEVVMDLLTVGQAGDTKEVVYAFRPKTQAGGALHG